MIKLSFEFLKHFKNVSMSHAENVSMSYVRSFVCYFVCFISSNHISQKRSCPNLPAPDAASLVDSERDEDPDLPGLREDAAAAEEKEKAASWGLK